MSRKKYLQPDNSLGARLTRYRLFLNQIMSEFEQLTNIPQSTLSAIENNKYEPSLDTLKKLVLTTDLNIHWLLTGEGEMLREEMEVEKKPDQGQAMQMLLDIFASRDSKAIDAIFNILEFSSGAVKRAMNDRRKVVDPNWPAEQERRKGGIGLKAGQG
jgi:transcriptional regulator with XRE-family HTH domain